MWRPRGLSKDCSNVKCCSICLSGIEPQAARHVSLRIAQTNNIKCVSLHTSLRSVHFTSGRRPLGLKSGLQSAPALRNPDLSPLTGNIRGTNAAGANLKHLMLSLSSSSSSSCLIFLFFLVLCLCPSARVWPARGISIFFFPNGPSLARQGDFFFSQTSSLSS